MRTSKKSKEIHLSKTVRGCTEPNPKQWNSVLCNIRNIPIIKFGSTPLEVVFDYVYLGCTFNYNSTCIKAIKRQHDVASRATFLILSKSRKLQLDIDTQLHLFNTMVVPIMMYGTEVWGYNNSKLFEKLQLRFGKIILHVR